MGKERKGQLKVTEAVRIEHGKRRTSSRISTSTCPSLLTLLTSGPVRCTAHRKGRDFETQRAQVNGRKNVFDVLPATATGSWRDAVSGKLLNSSVLHRPDWSCPPAII